MPSSGSPHTSRHQSPTPHRIPVTTVSRCCCSSPQPRAPGLRGFRLASDIKSSWQSWPVGFGDRPSSWHTRLETPRRVSCRPNDDSPILVVVPQLIALPSGKERIPVIKTEPSREMVAQPITSVASPSTPTPKRVSRNPWSSPSKALSSALDRTPSRQTSSTAPSPLSVVAPVQDLSKDPDDATEAVLGMFCFVFLCCGDSADIVETPSADRFYPVIVPGHKRAASSGSDILPPRKISRRAGAGTRKPRA